jgi:methionyl-tRNA formyltransferase
MNIVFMGTPQFSVPILEMLSKKHHVLAVVTQPDKKVGRKKEITFSPVKMKALSLNLPVFQPIQLKTDYDFILSLNPDLIVTAAYGQMLPKELLDQVTAINVHGSILPSYRGGAPIQYALFDGLSETGVTIMYMAFKMDSGDIIKQYKIHIDEDDNYQSLSQKLSLLGVRLLEEVLDDLTHGHIIRLPQDEKKVTFAKTLTYKDEMISFMWPSDKIINRIRGLSPEIGASATINGVVLKVYKAKKSDIMTLHQVPGTVLQSKKKLIIKTIDGAIELLEIQAPGKKKMSVSDFLNGQNIIKDGDVFIEGMS